MTKFFKFKKGFTLVEILLYMALLSIFLLTLVDILVSVLDVQLESQATSAVDIDSRFISSRLNYDILRASAIVTPASLGDVSDNLVMTIGGAGYTYSLSGGNLVLNDGSSGNNLNSRHLQVFLFKSWAAPEAKKRSMSCIHCKAKLPEHRAGSRGL